MLPFVVIAALVTAAVAAAVGLRRRGSRPRAARRALLQAVGEAEFAVLAAQVAGAPAADLDSLCRRLRAAAAAGGPGQPAALQGQAAGRPSAGDAELLSAARMIQAAAAAAIASLNAPPGQPGQPGQPGPPGPPTAAGLPPEAIAALITRAENAGRDHP